MGEGRKTRDGLYLERGAGFTLWSSTSSIWPYFPNKEEDILCRSQLLKNKVSCVKEKIESIHHDFCWEVHSKMTLTSLEIIWLVG